MFIAYLLIGGNIGNRSENLSEAVRLLGLHAGEVIGRSAVFETAPWGHADQKSFLNQAIAIQTGSGPEKLLGDILAIEIEMGRIRKLKNGPRVIDIDILFYENAVVDLADLTIPHPLVQNRRFALVPMFDLAPDLIHPVFGKTIGTLLQECPDQLEVHLYDGT